MEEEASSEQPFGTTKQRRECENTKTICRSLKHWKENGKVENSETYFIDYKNNLILTNILMTIKLVRTEKKTLNQM